MTGARHIALGALVALAALAWAWPGLAQVAPDRLAFVIGNQAYESSSDNVAITGSPLNLLSPRNDALGYVDALEAVGWTIINQSFSDRSRRSLENDLDEASTKVTEGSEVLFIFNGHGFTEGGENYLVGVPETGERYRSLGDMRAGSITLEDVISKLNIGRPARIILIINACGDEPLVSEASRAPARPRFDEAGNEILVLYSSSPRGIAYDFKDPGDLEGGGLTLGLELEPEPPLLSLFSRHFIPKIAEERPLLSLFTETRLAVEQDSVFAALDRGLPTLGWRQIPHVLYDTINGGFSLFQPETPGDLPGGGADWRADPALCRVDPDKRDEALALRSDGRLGAGPEADAMRACILEAALGDLGILKLGFDADARSVIVSETNTASSFRPQDRIPMANVVLEGQSRQRFSFQSLDIFQDMLARHYFSDGSKFVFGWRRADGTLPASGFEPRNF
ncbi:MAG: caspase family protein [Pseudomonadota bacterium]